MKGKKGERATESKAKAKAIMKKREEKKFARSNKAKRPAG